MGGRRVQSRKGKELIGNLEVSLAKGPALTVLILKPMVEHSSVESAT